MFAPIFKHQKTVRGSFILFALVLNICVVVEGKSLAAEIYKTKDEASKDPLVALPSEGQQMNLEQASAQLQSRHNPQYFATLSASSRQGEYEVSDSLQQQQQQQQQQPGAPLAQQDQSYTSDKQEGYYLVKPDGTVIQHVPTQALEAPNGKGRQEYISLVTLQQQPQHQQQASGEPRREYSGEVLYVDPNGHSAKPLNEIQQGQTQNQGSKDYSHVAGAISRSSGLPATILTEVPIRDMPLSVLEKLRKEYGVRVVATREHPGANLVINCDEHSDQDNSICSRQPTQAAPQLQYIQQLQPYYQERPNQLIQSPQLTVPQQQLQQPEPIQHTTLVQYSPYPVTSVDASGEQLSSEHPRVPGVGLTSAEAVEPPQSFHETRDGETSTANQDQTSTGQDFESKKQTGPENAYQSEAENQSREQAGSVNVSKEDHEGVNSGREYQ